MNDYASRVGFDIALTDTQQALADSLRSFATRIMRPAGIELDRMAPGQAIAPGSPFWDVRRKFIELGIGPSLLAGLPPEEIAGAQSMMWEMLGYGDAGLAVSMGSALLPVSLARHFGKPFIIERFGPELLGCWGLTEPDHGSDMLDVDRHAFAPDGVATRPNCSASVRGGALLINGQKSAWVSNGTIAEVCALFCRFDRGDGAPGGAVIYVPLDAPGVSRGQPLDKIGQRALNQGEIFFENVRLPLDYLAVAPEGYAAAVRLSVGYANTGMAAIFTGLAQAAFDLAFDYVRERKQGGVPLIRHQHVRYRVFQMFRKVETARALARRVNRYNVLAGSPSLPGAMAAKITATQTAFEVANEAVQLFGGYGLSREFPVEKLLRDARSALIEDGCNELLAIKGGSLLADSGHG
jgi:alkylation response protein AidB-like acyl-CoA dehydrogenase